MKSKYWYALALILLALIVLAARLLVSFQVGEPSYESYNALREARHVQAHGTPFTTDAFSYGGRDKAGNPFFAYLLALVSFVVPATIAAKILPNVLVAFLVPIAYLVGFALTRHRSTALLTAFFAGFAPALFTANVNTASSQALALPLVALSFWALFDVEAHPKRTLTILALLVFATPAAWLVILSLIVYAVILAAEKWRIEAHYIEVGFFAFLLASWYTLVTYKEALQAYGFSLLSTSLPETVRAATFQEFTLPAVIVSVGVIPLGLAAIALYHASFEQRNRKVFLLAAFLLTTLLAGVARVLPLKSSLVFASLAVVLLSAAGAQRVIAYAKKTRWEWVRYPVAYSLVLLFILTSLFPALVSGVYPGSSPTPAELEVFTWAKAHTTSESVIAAVPKSGFAIAYVAERDVVADTDYLLAPNPERVITSLDAAYTAQSTVAAVEHFERLGATHVLVGPREYERYDDLGIFRESTDCFPLLFENTRVSLYAVNCTVFGGDTS